MHYRPEIDGLRAIAVCAVIATHAGAPLPGGFLGVDLFFVISGFLITSILLREIEAGEFSLARFYERRARRILPALFVVVLACLPAAWLLMTPDQLKDFGQGLVALTFFASNILFSLKSGYFAPAAEENPLIHTWSLGVEEQFYVVFPLALILIARFRSTVWIWLACAALLSFAVAGYAMRVNPHMSFYLLPFRAWELLIGALAALAARSGMIERISTKRLWDNGPTLGPTLAVLGLGLIAFAFIRLHSGLSHLTIAMLIPVAGGALVILFARKGTLIGQLLSASPVMGLGLISYSAYLWHQPLFAFARLAHFDPPTPSVMVGLAVLTFALAWLTWRFVERPFRDIRRWSLPPLVLAAGCASVAVIAMGLSFHVSNGFSSARYSPEIVAQFESADPAQNRALCHAIPSPAARPETACVTEDVGSPSWAVFGDSHAVEFAQALGAHLMPTGDGMIQFSASGCPPALKFETDVPHCADWVRRHVEWLEHTQSVETVVLVWRHSSYLFGKNEHIFPVLPDETYRIQTKGTKADQRAAYWRSFTSMVDRLRGGGRRVIVVAPVPEIARPIGKYILFQDDAGPALRTVPRNYYDARNQWVLGRMTKLAERGIEILYPADMLCDVSVCYGARGDTAYYFDDNHLSMAGAHKVISELFDEPVLGAAPVR